MANQSKLKAWVRYDGTGRVVTAGPIFQANKPKVGNWRQINADLCCNPSGSTTTTTTTSAITPTAFTVRIAGGIEEACGDVYGMITTLYSASSTLGVNSTLYTDAGLTQPLPGLVYVRITTETIVYTSFVGTITQQTVCQPASSSFNGYAAGSFNNACTQSGGNPGVNLYSYPGTTLVVGLPLFFDSGLTSPYAGQYGDWFNVNGRSYRIDLGSVVEDSAC